MSAGSTIQGISASVTTAVAVYCVSGTLLTLVNKLAVVALPLPNTLLILQNGLTVLLLQMLTWSAPDTFGGKLPSLSFQVVVDWMPLVLLFVGMLGTSLAALLHVSAVTLIVIRNLCTLSVAFLEWGILGTEISVISIAALIGILISAVLYGLTDLSFSLVGYLWLTGNVACTAAFQILIKRLIRQQEQRKDGEALGPFGMSYFNNLLSLPVFATLAIMNREDNALQSRLRELSVNQVGVVIASGLLGFVLSTSAFMVNKLISATSMMVANNVNKFAVIILSELFVQRTLGLLSGAGTFGVILFGWFYSETKSKYSSGRLYSLFEQVGYAVTILFGFVVIAAMIYAAPTLETPRAETVSDK